MVFAISLVFLLLLVMQNNAQCYCQQKSIRLKRWADLWLLANTMCEKHLPDLPKEAVKKTDCHQSAVVPIGS